MRTLPGRGAPGRCVGGPEAEVPALRHRREPQNSHPAYHTHDPYGRSEADDGPPGHHLGQAPEGYRPTSGRREQQGGGRCCPHSGQQKRRHQRNLEQQRNVDEHAQGGRYSDAQQVVAKPGGNGVRADPLDSQPAGEPGDHHDGPQTDEEPQAGQAPLRQPLRQHLSPRRVLLAVEVRILRLRQEGTADRRSPASPRWGR